MARIVLFFLLLIIGSALYCQGVAINQDNSAPDPSAMLDVKSTSLGILLPRLTTTERDQLENPEKGLLIFNLTTREINSYNGSAWVGYSSVAAPTAMMKPNNGKDKPELAGSKDMIRPDSTLQNNGRLRVSERPE